MLRNIIFSISFSTLLLAGSCGLDPIIADNTTAEIDNQTDLRSLLDGAYSSMRDFHYYGRNYIIGVGEVRADNVFSNRHTTRFGNYSVMNVSPTSVRDDDFIFDQIYASIANPNIIINSDLSSITNEENEPDIDHMIGEAYAIRALAHFDALRGWGQQNFGGDLGISYVREFKPEDLNIPRGSVESNKEDLYNDIEESIHYLELGKKSSYESSKINITLDAAYALKYRIATYFRDYSIIRDDAQNIEKLIDKYPVTRAGDIVNYWAQSTPGEASIFELYLSSSETNGGNSIGSIYRGNDHGDIQAFDNLIKDVGFDDQDVRAQPTMIGFDSGDRLRNIGKYPDNINGSDNIKVFRIEEIILNYAEALIDVDPAKALKYLDMIPENRQASLYLLKDNTTLYENVLSERRKEFLFEGFRFFDLVRFKLPIREVDPTVLTHEEILPGDHRLALPIPQQELDANRATSQNPDYPD